MRERLLRGTLLMRHDGHELNDELRPEFDLRVLLRGGMPGKYVARCRAGINLFLLDPDVARDFPDETAVNDVHKPGV